MQKRDELWGQECDVVVRLNLLCFPLVVVNLARLD